MKRYFKLIILVVFAITMTGCRDKDCKTTSDEQKFKKEYEALNGEKTENGKQYLEITIPDNTSIKYASVKKVIEFMETGTGVIYFGFPECPWCRNALPVFLDVAKEYSPCEILYYNASSIRDKKELDEEGNVITTQEGTKEYDKILELLGDNASVYEGLNDKSIKRLYLPTMVFVKDGKIIGTHVATIDSQEDPYIALTTKQTKELKNIYKDLFDEIKKSMCTKNVC